MGYEPHMIIVNHDEKPYPIIFRTLTKEEYLGLTEVNTPEAASSLGTLYIDQYADIIRTALLHPVVLDDFLPAATDKLLAEAIVEASGWVSTNRLIAGLNEAREKATSLDGFLRSRILVAFPSMSLEKLNSMRFSELMNLVAMSESITGLPIDLQPWLDPDGYKKRIEAEERMQKRLRKEQEAGVQVDPRMRDPEFRKKLMAAAQESREKLGQKHDKINFDDVPI